jgi:Protein of unknown function (DUF3047)
MLRALLATLAIATTPAWSEDFAITPFSTAKPGMQLPAGWRPAMLARHRPTELVLVQDEGQVVLRVHAESAIGTAAYDMHVEMDRRPQLTWRWKIDHVVAAADTTVRGGEDFAARVYISFDVPVKSLSLVERAKLKMAKALYGVEVPTASLCYVWDNKLPPGTSRFSPYTERVRTIVLRSGGNEAGKWVTETRDVDADFRAAFGAEYHGPTPAVTGIAIGNDTDQTHESVTAWFGDFAWRVAP